MAKRPAVHAVNCHLRAELPRNGIILEPSNDAGSLGELKVGQGGIQWTAKGKQAVSSKRVSWTKFAEMMAGI